MALKIDLIFQLARFGLVGITAVSVHFLVLLFLVETMGLNPLQGNIFAFIVAFQVSYWGHRQWTFRGTTTQHRTALPKLLLVGIVGLVINEALFSFLLLTYHLPYLIALFFTLAILPLANFTIGKLWVFR